MRSHLLLAAALVAAASVSALPSAQATAACIDPDLEEVTIAVPLQEICPGDVINLCQPLVECVADALCAAIDCTIGPINVPCLTITPYVTAAAPANPLVQCLRDYVCALIGLTIAAIDPCDPDIDVGRCPTGTTGTVIEGVALCVGHANCPAGYVGHLVWVSSVYTNTPLLCVKVVVCSPPMVGVRVFIYGGPTIGNCYATNLPQDSDKDGWVDTMDDCPNDPDPAQADEDGDGIGNGCDPDVDNDGCQNHGAPWPCPNPDPDVDGDGQLNGAAGEVDDDNDGMPDAADPTPQGV